jgi:hypothetical protein
VTTIGTDIAGFYTDLILINEATNLWFAASLTVCWKEIG